MEGKSATPANQNKRDAYDQGPFTPLDITGHELDRGL